MGTYLFYWWLKAIHMMSFITAITQQHVFSISLASTYATTSVQHWFIPTDAVVEIGQVDRNLGQVCTRHQWFFPTLYQSFLCLSFWFFNTLAIFWKERDKSLKCLNQGLFIYFYCSSRLYLQNVLFCLTFRFPFIEDFETETWDKVKHFVNII
jgi:hypothetical protein